MSEEATQEVLDNIDIPLDGVELFRPQLDNVISEVTISDAKATRNDEGLRRLELKLTLEEPVMSTHGKEQPVGKVFDYSFLIDPWGGWTAKRAAEELGLWKAAATGIKTLEGGFGSPSQLVGKRVRVKWEINKKGFQNARPLLTR